MNNALKRRLPLGVLAVLLTLALAALGLVYGNWTQKLTVNGTVTTGGIDAEWQLPAVGFSSCPDSEFQRGIKNFAVTTQTPNGKAVSVKIANAYPNYFADCELEYVYTGQVPGRVDKINFEAKDLTSCLIVEDPSSGSFSATCNELKVEWADGLCGPMMQQGGFPHAGSFKVTVLKALPNQKASYDFNMSINIVQWDKSTCDA